MQSLSEYRTNSDGDRMELIGLAVTERGGITKPGEYLTWVRGDGQFVPLDKFEWEKYSHLNRANYQPTD